MADTENLVPSGFRSGGGRVRPQSSVAPVMASPGDGGDNTPGPGFRNTGAFRERGMQAAQLAKGAAEVGEPTSFRAGAGAPEPIAVMRGTATTFSPGRLPGHQFAEPEMATPLQAQQAWNRGMRGQTVATNEARGVTAPEETLDTQYGGFKAPGTSLVEAKGQQVREGQAAENKRPDLVAAAKIAEEKQAQAVKEKVGGDFESMAKRRWGTFDKAGKMAPPTDEFRLRDMTEAREYAMEQGNHQAGMQYMEWSQRLREMYPDVYATTMKTNPLAWRDIVVTHGPKIPATSTTAPAAKPGFTEPQGVTGGLSPYSVGP